MSMGNSCAVLSCTSGFGGPRHEEKALRDYVAGYQRADCAAASDRPDTAATGSTAELLRTRSVAHVGLLRWLAIFGNVSNDAPVSGSLVRDRFLLRPRFDGCAASMEPDVA